jgi:hypothetical protein
MELHDVDCSWPHNLDLDRMADRAVLFNPALVPCLQLMWVDCTMLLLTFCSRHVSCTTGLAATHSHCCWTQL